MDDGWYYEQGGQKVGPVSLPELKRLVATKVVVATTRVFATGMVDWVDAGNLAMLFPRKAELGMRMLLPVGRSGYAIAAGYLGLCAFIPFCAPLALLFAVLAIFDLRKHPEKTGWGRIITGLVLGLPFTAFYLFSLLRLLSSR